jgi:stress response protein YsnF
MLVIGLSKEPEAKVKSRCKEGKDFQNRKERVSGRKEQKETEEVAVGRSLKR